MIYDISPPISPELKVWPGDTPASREILCDMKQGDNITLSTLHATVHLGSHADGANHYGRDAGGIDERPLEHYLGAAQVVRVAADPATRVTRSQLPQELNATRLLIHTGSFPDPHRFNEDFVALDPKCIDQLHREGIRLVGIDTPSVDLFSSKDLPAHQSFLRHDMSILEGLRLGEVPEGIYELIALPLKLIGFDASPVRAVLRTMPPTRPA